MCPSITASAHTGTLQASRAASAGAMRGRVRWASHAVASQPFTRSITSTVRPTALPWVRSALVAPALPLPRVRMSTPRTRADDQAPDQAPEEIGEHAP